MSQEYSKYLATSPAETLIIHFCINITKISVKKMTVKPLGCNCHGKGGGGDRGLKPPTSHTLLSLFPPCICWLPPLCILIAKYCTMLHNFPFSSRFPPPCKSRFPPPLLPPPVHLELGLKGTGRGKFKPPCPHSYCMASKCKFL